MLTVPEAAEKSRVSAKTLRREIACGRLAVVKIRGCIRIREQDFEAYLEHSVCRSVVTGKGGKSGFSMVGADLAKLLKIGVTHSTSSEQCGHGSTILSLDARRNTASKKPSRAG